MNDDLSLRIVPSNQKEWDLLISKVMKVLIIDHPDYPKEVRYYKSFLKRILPELRARQSSDR